MAKSQDSDPTGPTTAAPTGPTTAGSTASPQSTDWGYTYHITSQMDVPVKVHVHLGSIGCDDDYDTIPADGSISKSVGLCLIYSINTVGSPSCVGYSATGGMAGGHFLIQKLSGGGCQIVRITTTETDTLEDCQYPKTSCGTNSFNSIQIFGGNGIFQCIDFCNRYKECNFWTFNSGPPGTLIETCNIYKKCEKESAPYSTSGKIRCLQTSDATGSNNVGFTNCPASLTYGGGTQKYRFVEDVTEIPPPTQTLPCTGDIDNCIYTAHTKYYCMMGNKPDYTPHELQPHWDNVNYVGASTFAGEYFDGNSDFGGTFTNFSTCTRGNNPIVSIKLFPNIYARRLVLGGFIFKSYPVPERIPSDWKPGHTDPLYNHAIEPTYIYLRVGDSITEATVRYGFLIDQLNFGITTNFINPTEPPRFQSAGGYSGAGPNNAIGSKDATPPPNLNGHCALLCLKGQAVTFPATATDPENSYIRALEFVWSCTGKPSHYVH